MCDLLSVSLVEKCTRFHIHSEAIFVGKDIADFDPAMNDENLGKCLKTLHEMYYDLNLINKYSVNEAEMMAYNILRNLNNNTILR